MKRHVFVFFLSIFTILICNQCMAAAVPDPRNPLQSRILKGHADSVCSIAFSPDGTKIATGSYDNTARIWDVETGELLHCLIGIGHGAGIKLTRIR